RIDLRVAETVLKERLIGELGLGVESYLVSPGERQKVGDRAFGDAERHGADVHRELEDRGSEQRPFERRLTEPEVERPILFDLRFFDGDVVAARATHARGVPGVDDTPLRCRQHHAAQLRRAGKWTGEGGAVVDHEALPEEPARVLASASEAPTSAHAIAAGR